MLSRLTHATVVIALGFGIAGAAAADNDHQLMSSSGASALLAPQASAAEGLSVIRENKPKAGQEEHALSSGDRTADDAFSGIALQNDTFANNPHNMLAAQREGVQVTRNGFTALKAGADQHGTDPLLQRLVLSTAKAETPTNTSAFSK